VKREYDFITAEDGKSALKKLTKYIPDIILCDVMMPEMDGYEFLKQVKSNTDLKKVPFLFLTARASSEMIVEGLEEGADDYIVKPFNSLELLARVRSLLRIRELMSETVVQKKKINGLTQKLEEKFHYEHIVGNSPQMRKIFQLLETIKKIDSTILIVGETGTGKEIIANTIHFNSSRKHGPMVSINCSAIPKDLIERELFGHVKGSFTGATESRNGYFQEADKGTLFLDELSEMSSNLQSKLLRVLEQGEIMRVGETVATKINVRFIAAASRDLLTEVKKGNFRKDLYYRIHVIPVKLPPLRKRSGDIPLLIEHFMEKFKSKHKIKIPRLTKKDLKLFLSYSFPGNVRELEHIVERFCLLGGNAEELFNEQVQEQDNLDTDFSYDKILSGLDPLKKVVQKAKTRAEKDLIIHTLALCNNNYTKAARMLNIGRSSIYRKLKN
jgi:DNA-binding NtrC family response regulator